MKKKHFLMAAFLLVAGMAKGQNALNVDDFVMPQNGGMMTLTLTLEDENVYTSYQFKIETPENLGYVVDSENDVTCVLGTGHSSSHDATAHWNESDRLLTVGVISGKSALLTGKTVTLQIPMSATTAAVGTTHDFTIKGITFIKQENATKVGLNDVSFTVTIGEPADTRIVLDETSTTAPEATTGVDVRVKRIILANEWSTICLPFAMTEAQVKTAFGDDVQLGDFTGYDTTEEADEVVGITVNFDDVRAIEANHPYIIKVSDKVTEFTVDGVTIEPVDNPSVLYGTTTGKGKNAVYHPKDFIGTYVADFDFYGDAKSYPLFLNGNKFYYATQNTMHMKAFRAYFDFDDYLAEAEEAASRVTMSFDNTTGIYGVTNDELHITNAIYDLQGRRVSESVIRNSEFKKGLYIKNGKKVVNK